VKLVGDRVVRGAKAGGLDLIGGDVHALLGVAQLAHELDVMGRVNELQLLDRRAPRRQQVCVLDQPGRADQVHSELDPNRLQRMLVRQVVLHQLVSVDERNRSGHCNLP
jgi:thiamine monophosphate kinase